MARSRGLGDVYKRQDFASTLSRFVPVAKFGNEYFRLPINVMRTVNVNLVQNLQ
jgi:hypothetical protein